MTIERDNDQIINSMGFKTKMNDNEVPLIDLKDVWKIYQMGEIEFAALKGIDLHINKGEFVAILGPSGSGKSTLMNQIGCLDIPTKGIVSLKGKDISSLDEAELAQIRGKTIGFIFQQFNLIPTLNSLENVMLPLEFQEEETSVARARARELLKIVGLEDKMQHMPSQLSGGQRQRVAIARSLAVNPEILLADEPTGALDSKTGAYILEFLNELHESKNKTIIMITHDNELLIHAEKIVHIKDGMIEKIEIKEKGLE